MRFRRSLLILFATLVISATSFAQVGVSITIGPPPLPVYEQPPCPSDGYIWTPGYWAYGPFGYYWVPGTWVLAPTVGYLWTPPWWGWGGSGFIFHEGYWGPHVGFYGGISYGFGYFGVGFVGGRWDGGHFFYNRSVTNINVTHITNVYNTTVINNNSTTINRVSYNGGQGGLTARPTAEEEAAARDPHVGATAVQTHHAQAALANPQLRDSVNHGKPSIAATPKPGAFNDRGAVAAREAGGEYKAANNVPRPPNATAHASDVPNAPRPTAMDTGNAKVDQRYQQQQNKLYNQQQKEHAKLQQQQQKEDQQMQRRNTSEAQKQQTEQRHEQQTQQMEERHTQQSQALQERQQRSSAGGGHGGGHGGRR